MGNAWPQPNRIGSGLEEVGVPAFPGYDFYQKKMAGPTPLCVPSTHRPEDWDEPTEIGKEEGWWT